MTKIWSTALVRPGAEVLEKRGYPVWFVLLLVNAYDHLCSPGP